MIGWGPFFHNRAPLESRSIVQWGLSLSGERESNGV
jgi:hypothetical protein